MKKIMIAFFTSLMVGSAFSESTLLFPKGFTFDPSSKTGMENDLVKIKKSLNADKHTLVLTETKKSLLGNHYTLQHMVNGLAVANSQLVISTEAESSKVTKIYSNLSSPTDSNAQSLPLISQEKAFELAWQAIKGGGSFIFAPKQKLVFSKQLELIYQIDISSTAPYGHWSVTLNAITGAVVEIHEETLPRMKRKEQAQVISKSAQTTSYLDAKNKFVADNNDSPGEVAQGTAQVFDPNPVTALGRTDLSDNSSASEFLKAYKTEDLKDITLQGGLYRLIGPKVTIVDFESPRVAPSTTTDGHWVFERKNVAFNDAMTYLHIDRSIRYIESLGFTGSKVIFPKSLQVDANAVNGQDNSYYSPSSRSLAFGHGGVDDNEDSEVILHELGHAIHHHINSSWNGGDTGAMGEGFGDYWAASYTVTTDGGMDTNPNWVFKWDGHNSFWPGRKLDATSLRYNPRRTYGAHSPTDDGGESDELWSTPVFQAFLELYKAGVPKADIDKIILEAHFGLGSGVKMPQMATSIVKTAKMLFPNNDYDQVFMKHFKLMNIL